VNNELGNKRDREKRLQKFRALGDKGSNNSLANRDRTKKRVTSGKKKAVVLPRRRGSFKRRKEGAQYEKV